MLNVIRKIVIWIIGLPILLISICFITVASMLTTVGTFVFKSISVLAILLALQQCYYEKRALEKLIGIYNGDTFEMRDQVF